MISRVYTVLMPTNGSTDIDIDVEGFVPTAPGTAQTVTIVGDGFFTEWRNRPLRVPIKAGSAAAVAAGFVPRLLLGFSFSLQQHVGALSANQPVVFFSRSLVGDVVSTTAGVTTPGDGTFQDPSGLATIRVENDAAVAGKTFRLYLQVMEAKDDASDGQS